MGRRGNLSRVRLWGGDRFIYRLNGKPLFHNIGANAKIQHLQMTVINIEKGTGAIANSNAGLICGSSISGDVALNDTIETGTFTAGAFVGTNESTGKIFCSYQIGDTQSNNKAGTVNLGGLVGTNSGEIANCYHAGKIVASSSASSPTIKTGGIVVTNTAADGNIVNNYYNNSMASPTVTIPNVTGKTSSEMTKNDFVTGITGINKGIDDWHNTHTGFDWHQYQYNPANYPTLSDTLKTKTGT